MKKLLLEIFFKIDFFNHESKIEINNLFDKKMEGVKIYYDYLGPDITSKIASQVPKQEIYLNGYMKEWLIIRSIFRNKTNTILHPKLTKVNQLKTFTINFHRRDPNKEDDYSWLAKDFTVNINGVYDYCKPCDTKINITCEHFSKCRCLENFNSDSFPNSLVKSSIYLTELVKPNQIELLNIIYEKYIQKNIKIELEEHNKEIFTLFPDFIKDAFVEYNKKFEVKPCSINYEYIIYGTLFLGISYLVYRKIF